MKTALVFAITACLGWHGVAAAQASEPVSFDTADLATPDRAAAVLAQIEDVAHRVCKAEHSPGYIYPRAMRRCTTDTVRRAVVAFDAPALTRVYSERLGDRSRARLERNVALIAWPTPTR